MVDTTLMSAIEVGRAQLRKPTWPATPPPISTYAMRSPGTTIRRPRVSVRERMPSLHRVGDLLLDGLEVLGRLEAQLARRVLDADLDLHVCSFS